ADDATLLSDLRGLAIVGDFDADGFDDLAAYRDGQFAFDLTQGTRRGWDGVTDVVVKVELGGPGARPLAADIDGDGRDDLGLWLPDGPNAPQSADWYWIVSREGRLVDASLSPGDPGHRV